MTNDADCFIFHVNYYIVQQYIVTLLACMNTPKGKMQQGEEKQSIHSVIQSCVAYILQFFVSVVFSAPGASCSSPLWKRKRKRKPELTPTPTHIAYSHMWISFFWVKVSGHCWRICSDRTGTKSTTTTAAGLTNTTQCYIQHNTCDDYIFPQYMFINRGNTVQERKMILVQMWACISYKNALKHWN